MRDRTESLPPDVLGLIREPVVAVDRARRIDAIMRAVRDERAAVTERATGWPPVARQGVSTRPLPPALRRLRRGVLAPLAGVSVALAVVLTGGLERMTGALIIHGAAVAHAEVVGDTIVPRSPGPSRRVTATTEHPLRDPVVATLYDTLRIVRFALRAPHAARVALVRTDGLAGPAPRVAAVTRSTNGRWEVRAAVPRDVTVHAYALVVDGGRAVPVRPATSRQGSTGAARARATAAAPLDVVTTDTTL